MAVAQKYCIRAVPLLTKTMRLHQARNKLQTSIASLSPSTAPFCPRRNFSFFPSDKVIIYCSLQGQKNPAHLWLQQKKLQTRLSKCNNASVQLHTHQKLLEGSKMPELEIQCQRTACISCHCGVIIEERLLPGQFFCVCLLNREHLPKQQPFSASACWTYK